MKMINQKHTHHPIDVHVRNTQPGQFWLVVLTAIVLTVVMGVLAQVGGVVRANSAQAEGDQKIFLPVIRKPIQPPPPPPNNCGSSYPGAEWPMVAANPQRTSWTPEEVCGNLRVEWYRPIEAYISQNTQVIASNGLLYISTSRGLYALDAATGAVAWRFDSELPLGNSPTVHQGVVYVGGYDRKLHALNALSGTWLWSFNQATAGYDTNPLVVNGRVFVGNRDGYMYAIGAHGTPQQGQMLWRYKTDAPIHLSAAYHQGVIYFASNDNHAYALRADNGQLLWKSQKLPGDGYQSYWPVIYQNKVVFSAAVSYRPDTNPGTRSVGDDGNRDIRGIWPEMNEGALVGPEVPTQPWSNGYPILDAYRLTQLYEDNPNGNNPSAYKPWRRAFIVLDLNSGVEFTYDSDGDGRQEYIPVFWWHTNSGNIYPGISGPDGLLYHNNAYRCCSDAKGKIFGWNIESPSLLSMVGSRTYGDIGGGFGAMAEPQAISAGGNIIYRNLCCDRVGDWFSMTMPRISGQLWSYNLGEQAHGYDETWFVYPESIARLWAWYQGEFPFYENKTIDPHTYNSVNGIYASVGIQNPLIPYNGRIYVHRGNAIIAYGPGNGPGKLPLLGIQVPQQSTPAPAQATVVGMLEVEIQKIVDAGDLRPGYYVIGQHADYARLWDYFNNPGETLYTLSSAYPYLSAGLQTQVRNYLADQYQRYFVDEMIARVGWVNGAPREAMPLPDDIAAYMYDPARDPNNSLDRILFPSITDPGFAWSYPPYNLYSLYSYALHVPGVNALQAYNLAKSRLVVPVPALADTRWFRERPYEHNAYLTGYIGFLRLQELAGMTQQDASLRQQVIAERDRLLQLKYQIFSKDTWWVENPELFPDNPDRTHIYQRKEMDIARNFMWLVPELGDYLYQNLRVKVQEAVDEYNYVAPYWFVARYESFPGEGVSSVLWNYPAVFQAKAYALKQPYEELAKYIDAPAFLRGDLFYIQNLVAALQASPQQVAPQSSGYPRYQFEQGK